MLHGVLFDHSDFATYCRYFSSRGYDCYAFSRRGRAGLTPANADGVRVRDYLDDTRRVLDAVGGRPAVIGHSLGALLAQMVAEEDRCRAIVLIAPHHRVALPSAHRRPRWPSISGLRRPSRRDDPTSRNGM